MLQRTAWRQGLAGALMILMLSGCGATQTALYKRRLAVQTKMSASIFLDPVPASQKVIFLQIRNTADHALPQLPEGIKAQLEEKGYRVVEALDQAHYLLQVNVLQVGRCDLKEAEKALVKGFGSTVGGGLAGAAIGSLSAKRGHRERGAVIGGLAGMAATTVANALIEDVAYTVITDVQISERTGKTVEVKQKTQARLKQGLHGTQEMVATEKVNWKRYQTRVVSMATQVNLKFEKALPELVAGLSRCITGVF